MGFWGRERSCINRDPYSASISLFWDAFSRPEESELEIEAFIHSLTFPNVSTVSAPFPSSSTSDAHVGSTLYLDIGGDGPRKLNCGVMGRSTSRRTGCEGKLWPVAERDFHDQDVLIRTFPSSVGYSEGSCAARSESQQCIDGTYEQSECITAANDGHESEDDGVENIDEATGSEAEYGCQEEQPGNEEHHGQVTETGHDRRPTDEAELGEEPKQGLQLCGDRKSSCSVTKSSPAATLMPAKPADCLQITKSETHLHSIDQQKLRRCTESHIRGVGEELGRASRSIFQIGVQGAESADHINKGGGRGSKDPQLAERGSSSHEVFVETLDVVGSRRDDDERCLDSWGDDLRGTQSDQLSFQGEDTVECITNVGEDDDFGFDVEEFQTPHAIGEKDEPEQLQEILRTESRSEFPTRGQQQSQGSHDRQSGTPNATPTFESSQAQAEKTLRARAVTRFRSNEKAVEESHPRLDAATSAGRRTSERQEAGAGRVAKGTQEKDGRGEGHLQRKSEASLVSEERRVRARLDGPPTAITGRGEETEEATKVVRPSRPSGGKDRHSKVNTAKGPRDRRVRLSVPTAVQFYDVQDRLGYDQPSKAVEWLIKKAKAAIDELGRLPSSAGSDGPSSTLSDITHASPFSAASALAGPVSGSLSCPPAGSFSAAFSSPFGDHHIGNHMNYFIDSGSIQQGMPFGNHPVHARDHVVGIGISQTHLATGHGPIANLSFPLGQTDLSRGNPGCIEGGKLGEFPGSPVARLESRVKARERARERAKEKCTGQSGRDGGKANGGGSSPSSMQSPPLHQNPIHNSFPVQNINMQGSVHSLSLQGQAHARPLQSSISNVFNTTISGIMAQSSHGQQGTLQNLIMQNPSLQSPLTDQPQTSLQHPLQASLQSALQSSQSRTSLQDTGIQQQSHLHIPSLQLEGSTHGALHLGSEFTPGLCSSSFSEAASLSSSDFLSIPALPGITSLAMSQLSAFGITSPNSMGTHFSTGSNDVHIPPGFSPGPPASSFRPGRPKEQQHLQGLSRPQCQLILPSKTSAPLQYYSTTSSRMGGSVQPISPNQLESASLASISRNVNYENYQRGLQMMSPGRTSSSGYQTSSSQLQMPARIQGLDDFEDELTSPPPSSPHVHP